MFLNSNKCQHPSEISPKFCSRSNWCHNKSEKVEKNSPKQPNQHCVYSYPRFTVSGVYLLPIEQNQKNISSRSPLADYKTSPINKLSWSTILEVYANRIFLFLVIKRVFVSSVSFLHSFPRLKIKFLLARAKT